MKTIVTSVLAALLLLLTSDADAARKRPRKPPRVRLNKMKQVRPKPAATLPTSTARDDVHLSPKLLRALQANLVDGGYLGGAPDGRLTARTRHAIAAFQAEYKLASARGVLDRATADALLGREVIDSYLVAHNEKRPGAQAPGRRVAARR